ncbi:MAG: UDP-N-acetylmuramoyl-L-alanyl-D-glutamate--2,6-diaminopimelate ligase [Candidatus Sumerlaeia bacterium]|nr:UDP-N-acetylmuramoyl-L-alanyl-D-glutamate--2,6-diaminopimelate ligase [Candidatus Sumerlaeia bacterium]
MYKPESILLRDLITASGLNPFTLVGTHHQMVTDLSLQGNKCIEGSLFIAIVGTHRDGHEYAAQAVANGAKTLLVQRRVEAPESVTQLIVPDTRKALGLLAHVFFGCPSEKLTIGAVTGTNGKTSTAWTLASIFRAAGLQAGLIGTLGAQLGHGDILRDTNNTTPDALALHRLLAEMYQAGVRAVAMEASSHGIDQERLAGIRIDCAALTNITQDHLDYHKTFENYKNAKKRLFFDCLKLGSHPVAVFNVDDPSGAEFSQEYVGDQLRFSCMDGTAAEVRCTNIRHQPAHTSFDLHIGAKSASVVLPLVGEFTVANSAAAASMAHAIGVPLPYIVQGIQQVLPVPGRFESVDAGQDFRVVVDYAHTPDALEKTLRTARRLCTGKVICVFGCGGDRDATKRPIMGRVVDHYADQMIITSDNPRNEDPQAIARDIRAGISRRSALEILDRALAIERAIFHAKPGDTVVICGKGHETTQELDNGIKIAFDDRAVARTILEELLKHKAGKPEINSLLSAGKDAS